MASRAAVRASDADRERVADCLREAAAEGRLLTEELEQPPGAPSLRRAARAMGAPGRTMKLILGA